MILLVNDHKFCTAMQPKYLFLTVKKRPKSTWAGWNPTTNGVYSYWYHVSHLIYMYRTSYIMSRQWVWMYYSWSFKILNCWYLRSLVWCEVVVLTMSIDDGQASSINRDGMGFEQGHVIISVSVSFMSTHVILIDSFFLYVDYTHRTCDSRFQFGFFVKNELLSSFYCFIGKPMAIVMAFSYNS